MIKKKVSRRTPQQKRGDSRKRVLKGVVREGRNARNTKVRRYCGVEALCKSRVLAKAAANLGVGRGEVAAAAELCGV